MNQTKEKYEGLLSSKDENKRCLLEMQMTAQKFLTMVGEDLSDIINQDGDDVTDGEVVDQVTDYLKELKIYKERKLDG